MIFYVLGFFTKKISRWLAGSSKPPPPWRAPTAIAMGVDQNDGALGVGRYGTPYIDCCANTPSHSFNPMFPHQWCH
jgi:hypothetical protein